jgi:hypothetical protein
LLTEAAKQCHEVGLLRPIKNPKKLAANPAALFILMQPAAYKLGLPLASPM